MSFQLNTIEEALEAIKNGKVIIVVDDENRENEGDFVFPAQIINKEVVNFMIKNGRGLVCVPMTSKRCKKLLLQPMVLTGKLLRLKPIHRLYRRYRVLQ